MDFLVNNWFQVLTLVILAGGWLIQYGMAKSELKSIRQTLDEAVDNFDDHVETFNRHVADPDLHVNRNLRELLDIRFRELHNSVGLIQKTLDKM